MSARNTSQRELGKRPRYTVISTKSHVRGHLLSMHRLGHSPPEVCLKGFVYHTIMSTASQNSLPCEFNLILRASHNLTRPCQQSCHQRNFRFFSARVGYPTTDCIHFNCRHSILQLHFNLRRFSVGAHLHITHPAPIHWKSSDYQSKYLECDISQIR